MTVGDVAEHLETEEDMAAYLDAALEDGDFAVVMASTTGNPEFVTVLKVVRAFGLHFQVQTRQA